MTFKVKKFNFLIKRFVDLALIVIFLPIIICLFTILYAIVALVHRNPVIFSQIRPGLRGKPFKILKFRTMNSNKDSNGVLLPDSQRLTRFGSFLRSTSLDELPSVYNVLRGEMSLVGPRPLLMDYLPLYNHFQARRHEVKPGLTGWAQVNGRNALTWEEKFDYDVWYVDNHSFFLDIQIIFRTVSKILKRSDISAEGEATMSKFEGSKSPMVD